MLELFKNDSRVDGLIEDLGDNNEIDNTIIEEQGNLNSSEDVGTRILSFKDFKGFKRVENIKNRYKIGRVIGNGSFG